ncbi:MAG: bifunctional metallophosphatase/5'-nucleotidase [Fusobacteriaceae bacterium]
MSKVLILGTLISMLLIGCGGSKEVTAGKESGNKIAEFKEEKLNLETKIIKKGEAGKDEVTLNFASTSDMHGRIYPYEYGIGEEVPNAGFGKVNTIVKDLRIKNPNLVLIDVGDTVQDNSAELFNNLETHPMVEAMNSMNYDVWVLGNHEFNFEKEFIMRNIKNFKGAVVNANVKNEEDNSHFVLPYQLFEVEGVRVAVIGVLPPHIPMWEASAPEHFKGLTFENPMDSVKEVVKSLEGQYDVLIGAVHLGRKDEYGSTGSFDLAKEIPEFDIIFAGHEHAKHVTDVDGTPVLESGAYGWGVATGEIKLKKTNGKWEKESVVAENIETKTYEADKDILKQFEKVHEVSLADANQVIGKVEKTFIDGVDFITKADKVTTMATSQIQDTAIIQLINDVQMHYAKADISSAAIFNSNSNLKAGDFKKMDVAFIYKYTNTLMGVNMTGENLLKFMEWSANYYNTSKPGDVTVSFNEKVRGYNYDIFDGITYDIDISKESGQRIVNAKIKGEPVDLAKTYKVAVNNYRFGTLMNLKLINETDKYYDSYTELQDAGRVRELIVKYVQEELKGKLEPNFDNNWKIIGIEKNAAAESEIFEKIKKGEIIIPKSADGRTDNVKSINVNEI